MDYLEMFFTKIVGMAKELGVSDRQIKKYHQRLTEQKQIERQGGRRNGIWHIIDKDYERYSRMASTNWRPKDLHLCSPMP